MNENAEKGETALAPHEAPSWLRQPSLHFRQQARRLVELMDVIDHGLIEVSNWEPPSDASAAALESELQKTFDLNTELFITWKRRAQHELDNDLPLIRGQAVVTLWTLLETAVRDVVKAWLVHAPGSVNDRKIAGIKIPLGQFMAMSEDQRLEFLVTEMDRSINVGDDGGIARQEALLEYLGLAGEIPAQLKADLVELVAVRNVLVHRSGIADARLKKLCPDFDANVGDPIRVTTNMFSRYYGVTHHYMLIVVHRAIAKLQS